MRSNFKPKLLAFSEAAQHVAESIRDSPSNRVLHGSLVLGVADALIQYQDWRRQQGRTDTVEPNPFTPDPPHDLQI